MTHTTPRLDRAIMRGMMAIGGNPINESEKRRFAQALIADLLLPDPPAPVDPSAEVITIGGFDYGALAYEHMLKVRAGLVKESDDE